MTDYPMPETVVAEKRSTLSARLSAPVLSASAPAVRIGAWVLAAALGIPAIVTLSRMLTLIVISLILGH